MLVDLFVLHYYRFFSDDVMFQRQANMLQISSVGQGCSSRPLLSPPGGVWVGGRPLAWWGRPPRPNNRIEAKTCPPRASLAGAPRPEGADMSWFAALTNSLELQLLRSRLAHSGAYYYCSRRLLAFFVPARSSKYYLNKNRMHCSKSAEGQVALTLSGPD